MKTWLRRIRGAAFTGLTWAVAWAVAGVMIGVASKLLPFLPWDAYFRVFDAPLPAMGLPGFFGGVFFSIVLGIAGRQRKFRDLSLARFAVWGALGGVLLILFPFALAAVGLASLNGTTADQWRAVSVISAPFILLSTGSAVGSLMLAKKSEEQALQEL
jgi:hypothetical protein